MKFLTSGKYLVSLARRAASTRSVLENRKCTLTLSLRKSQTLLIEMESRQDLRTGSGFARTNLARVVCTRSRGDALGGETDMSTQNPRYAFGNPKCVSLFSSSSKFALFDHVRHLRRSAAYWLLVERLDEMGARFKLSWARPTNPWNPDRRQLIWELRSWQVNGEKLSSKDKPCLRPPFNDERWDSKFEFEWTRVRCGLSLGLWRGWWSGQGSGAVSPQGLQGLSKALVSLQARGKPSWRSQPWPRTDASGDKIKGYRTNEHAFLSEIDRSTNLQHLH